MLRRTALCLALAPLARSAPQTAPKRALKISLAQWSLHRAIRSRLMTNLDFPRVAREQFGIEGLEFVNTLWGSPTNGYVQELKSNMAKTGTKGVLIMCDDEGAMGHSDKNLRLAAARNHFKWVDYAAELGCQSIRTNMYSEKDPTTPGGIDAFLGACAESFRALCEYGAKSRINIIIENHGGLSSNPEIVVRLMKMVNLPNFGTLPDFGNFPKEIDKYDAIAKLMPYAKGVSFKCFDFANGRETTIDMDRMMKIVFDSGYKEGWVGIEYEGSRLTEFEGIQAAKTYLDKAL